MRTGITIEVSPENHRRLEALVRDRSAPQKHVWRARIVLLSDEGLGTNTIMRETGKSKTCVWRWQERFADEGVAGLLRDKTRRSRISPLDQAVVERVVELTPADPNDLCGEFPQGRFTSRTLMSRSGVSWTRRMVAKATMPARARHRSMAGAEVEVRGPCRIGIGHGDERSGLSSNEGSGIFCGP